MWLCLVVCCCLFELKIVCLFAFALNVFTLLFFYQSFLVFMSKIQKHIKSWKSKKVDRHRCVLSQNIFCLVPLYKWPCAFKSVACFLSIPYLCGRNLDIYVTIVNRSSNLSWMSSQWYCWSWDMHGLVPIYLPTILFYFFWLKSSTNVNLQMKRDNELQKPVAHTSIWLGKRESDLK